MAKRRLLKKNVNYITSELFTECLIIRLGMKEEDQPKADTVLVRILNMQNEFLSRISHTEKNNPHKYYKHFFADYNKELQAIMEELSKLN